MEKRPGLTDHEGRVIDFGRTASDYEHYRPGFPDDFFDQLFARQWLTEAQKVLDLGTGTGSLALGFAARGLQVTGLDISSELLEIVRQRALDNRLDIELIEATAESTKLKDSAFDLVSAGQCWWWFDSDSAIVEAVRVLVPGGRLVICNFSYLSLPGNVAERTEQLVLQHNPGWPRAGWRGVHPEQVRALDEGGFEQVESFSYVVDVPFDHASWRGRMRTCNGVGSALSDDQSALFDRELAALLAADFPPALAVPHRVFATSGITPAGGGV